MGSSTICSSLLVKRKSIRFLSDQTRVISREFRPGNPSQVAGVFDCIAELTDDAASQLLERTVAQFAGRHRDIEGVLHRRQVIQLPAPENETLWTTFTLWSFCDETALGFASRAGLVHLLLRVLPGLMSVVCGQVSLTGVTPRSQQQLHNLRPDWRTLCLRSKAGLITEAIAVYGSESDRDELYSAEAFYSVKAGPAHDLGILIKYVRRLCKRGAVLTTMGDNT